MIDAEEATLACIVEREEGDVVVVVAELLQLRFGALPQRIESGRVGKQRIAPAEQHVGLIALGDVVSLIDAGFDFREGEAVGLVNGVSVACPKQRRPEQRRAGGRAERAAQHRAAAVALEDEVADRVASCRAQRHIVMRLKGLGPVAETVAFRHMPVLGSGGAQD